MVLIGVAAFPYLRTIVAAQPGEANDPLVTRRYVDERIDTLWTEIQTLRSENAVLRALVEAGGTPGFPGGPFDIQAITAAIFADVMISFETMYGEMLREAASAVNTVSEERSLEFAHVRGLNGQTLIIENGTEIILRSGAAVVVAGPNGLTDATAGADILNGETVRRNHMIIAPATDGRGIRFTADSWIMVRGAYTLN
jgi:hypothetical protein